MVTWTLDEQQYCNSNPVLFCEMCAGYSWSPGDEPLTLSQLADHLLFSAPNALGVHGPRRMKTGGFCGVADLPLLPPSDSNLLESFNAVLPRG